MVAGPFTTLFNQNVVSPGAVNAAKNWTWGGMHFQSEFSINPALFSEETSNIADLIEAYEAIVVLPLAQGGFTSPAYTPIFTNVAGGMQVGDAGDRVLWKRISILPFWGTGTTGGLPQLETTIRDVGHGPEVIRAKARLSEREGVFHVVNFVHGMNLTASPGAVAWDGWFRQAVKLSR